MWSLLPSSSQTYSGAHCPVLRPSLCDSICLTQWISMTMVFFRCTFYLFIYFFICTLGILGFRTGIYYIDFLLWSKTLFIYLEISLEKEGLSYLKIRTCHLDSFYFLFFWVHVITSIVKYINIYKSSIKRKIPT